MKISSGVLRGRRIKTKRGLSTRPLLSSVRKSLFDILGDRIQQEKFLDLYAGSGAVGIEALSRGAREVSFVEIDSQCIKLIRENLFRCHVLSKAKVYQGNVLQIIFSLLEKESFSFVFVSPPYFKNLQNKTLDIIQNITGYQGEIIIQHSPLEKINLKRQDISLIKEKRYGDTCLSFIFKKEIKNG